MRILALIPDAFGGYGGIALYNRDLLTALCAHQDCTEVIAIPRLMPNPPEPLPENLTYVTRGINSKIRYISTVLQVVKKESHIDLIICGHINLLPIAHLLRLWLKVPVLLVTYGIEVWKPTRNILTNYLVGTIDAVISISEVTQKRFLNWAKLDEQKGFLLPNAIHSQFYGVGPKNDELLKRYGLNGKIILMTLGRLVSEDRCKGFDEIIELLPQLAKEMPNVAYLIVGKGSDQRRLENKAKNLGVADKVIFTGFIGENEKADHYRLADVYVMPSRGEGFGFVFLEAMACGIPVIASKVDGGREAVLDGKLGFLVNPNHSEEIKVAISAALKQPREVPTGLEYFSFSHFTQRLHCIIDKIIKSKTSIL